MAVAREKLNHASGRGRARHMADVPSTMGDVYHRPVRRFIIPVPMLTALLLFRRAARVLGTAATLLVLAVRPAHAQRVLGPGDDATTQPRGGLRLRLGGQWEDFDQILGATRGAPSRPLGHALFTDTMSVGFLPFLADTRRQVRLLTGDTLLPVSAGALRGSAEARNWSIPLRVDVGVTRWLTVNAAVSMVRNFTSSFLQVNPRGTFANLGLNPAVTSSAVRDVNAAVATQIAAAGTQLSAAFPCLATSPTSPACAGALAASQRLGAMGSGITAVYVNGLMSPLVGSKADTLLSAQFAALNTQLRGLLGVATDPLTLRPTGAAARMGSADFYRLLGLNGFGDDSLGQRGRVTAGDYEFGAKVRFLDTFGAAPNLRIRADGFRVRSAVQVLTRIGSGHPAVGGVWMDQGTSTKTTSLELRSITDVQVSRLFWGTVSLRTGRFGSESSTAKLTVNDVPVLATEVFDVTRQRGGWRQVDLTPRVVFSDYFAAAFAYSWRSVDDDTFRIIPSPTTPVPTTPSIPVGTTSGLRPAGIDGILSRGGNEQRIGIGFSYSTLAARQRGIKGIPIEMTYLHQQTMGGFGLPKRMVDGIEFKLYFSPAR